MEPTLTPQAELDTPPSGLPEPSGPLSITAYERRLASVLTYLGVSSVRAGAGCDYIFSSPKKMVSNEHRRKGNKDRCCSTKQHLEFKTLRGSVVAGKLQGDLWRPRAKGLA